MLKTLLILASLVLAAKFQSVVITQAFNDEWKGDDRENKVIVNWDTNEKRDAISFGLSFPNITTEGIETLVFLRNNATSFIPAFNPQMTRKTTGTNTTQNYNQTISFTDFDNPTNYPCARAESDNVTTITCRGVFSIVVKTDVSDTNRTKNFEVATTKGLITYNFVLVVKVDKLVTGGVSTFVRTKIKQLPCTSCQCSEVCQVLQGFTASVKLCQDATCAASKTDAYVFGDEGIIEITVSPATRKFDLHQWYAQSPGSSDEYFRLNNNYIKSWNNSVAGKVVLKLDIAGPANVTGAEFNLRFVLKAQAARMLGFRERVLQSEVAQALSADLSNVKYNSTKPKPNVVTNTTDNKNKDNGVENLNYSILMMAFIILSFIF